MFLFRFDLVLIAFLVVADNRSAGVAADRTPGGSKKYPGLEPEAHARCYPSVTDRPLSLPTSLDQSPKHWWCSQKEEYSWLGFSYHVGGCPSRAVMANTFGWMRLSKKARYVRLYGGCDHDGFDDDVIEAAAEAGVGIYALIWFGFDNDDKWKGRKARLLHAIKENPKAPYVIRTVTCGSEPLYDKVLPVLKLVAQIEDLKNQLEPFGIPVTLSEMPAGYKANNDTPEIFKAVDFVCLHSFAFFEGNATTADHAQVAIRNDVEYGLKHGRGKKVVITQTGWPSNTKSWKANSPDAIADIAQEKRYFEVLDEHCDFFKAKRISWFAHIYNETTLAGWGIYYGNGTAKFHLNPRTSC
ncbi:hypothetical protein PGT21_008056 [Puccinia graminis f. sp. tritici]|uniref:glucan endo-1,3-beta-D-glucosidase n=1 Tax=Puccinia graminis f. sp. tritici TaxID=56615 RepID=A0A5B0QN19_PUCGR|nr:hypothetical protein PGT21_008056 [Puccinia graminis f. sp. tritici]